MSKLNTIEKKLSEIDATKFHKLVDIYLNKKYHYPIHSTGAKTGEDKPTKGTPDTLITLPNGQYIFVEYTTQKTSIKKKFLKDIENCLDESKTGINIAKIDKIVLACNHILNSGDMETLKQACGSKDCEVLTNSSLACDINNNFQIIAKDFLGIEVDTGQILDVNDFISTYDSSKYATPLNIGFKFRKDESDNIYTMLDSCSVVLLTGKAGIGKTRLALEVGEQYARNKDYTYKCILERGVNIFDDIKSYFHEEKPFLVFIDDVNRIHTALTYIKEYYSDKLTRGSIKLILTVRDYAKDKVIENLNGIYFKEIEIYEFKSEEIRELIKDEYQIVNQDYLERIEDLSKGNPRLALMIAKIAKENNTLESINDISNVYDEYFSSIFKESNIAGDTLKVAAIIGFFRVVDRKNEIQMDLIHDIFHLNAEDFWKHTHKLHEQELCDFYEDEVVKISDQVVSTYLFYYVVFKKKLFNIDIFIQKLFLNYPKKMDDVLIPLMSSFNIDEIKRELQPSVDQLWVDNKANSENMMQIMTYFWYLKETDILIYCKEYIDSLESETIDNSTYDLNGRNDNLYSTNEILEILSVFRSSYHSFKLAFQIILTYFEIKPILLQKEIVSLLTQDFGYTLNSHKYGYFFEKIVLDEVWKKSENGDNILFTKLYLEIVKYYLKLNFESSISRNGQSIYYSDVSILKTDESKSIRRDIWDHIFKLYDKDYYKIRVINTIQKYIYNIKSFRENSKKILKYDSSFLLIFISENLQNDSFRNCKIVQKYLSILEKNDIDFPYTIKEKFLSYTYEVSQIIDIGRVYYKKEYDDISWEEMDKIHKNNLEIFLRNYQNIDDYKLLLNAVNEIYESNSDTHNLDDSIKNILQILSEKNEKLFINVLKIYFKYESLSSSPYNCNMEELINILGKNETYDFLIQYIVHHREQWLFFYYENIPSKMINSQDVMNLVKLYREAKEYIPYNFGFIENYNKVSKNTIQDISKIVYEKSLKQQYFLNGLMALFHSRTELNKNLTVYFENDLNLLKKLYCAYDKFSTYGDYDCQTLNQILDIDFNFIEEYIHRYIEDNEDQEKINYDKDMQKLWERNDYEKVIKSIVNIYANRKSKGLGNFIDHELLFLFSRGTIHGEKIEIAERQKDFLVSYIEEYVEDIGKMKYIFDLTKYFSDRQKKDFIAVFISKNTNPKHIYQIIKEPSSYSWSGSAVIYFTERKEYYKSLFELFSNDIEFIEHRHYIEEIIKEYECKISYEKKREFMRE